MPFTLTLFPGAILGAGVGLIISLLYVPFVPARRRLKAKTNRKNAWGLFSLFLLPTLIFVNIGSQYFSADIHKWFATPIVATMPTGELATGHWWVDQSGVGHTQISAQNLTCNESYNGKNDAAFVFTTATCSDAIGAQVWVERFGNTFKDRGEGVWKRGDQYGWYIFGWKARLAILTGGWLGLPLRAALKSDFTGIASRADRLGASLID